MGISNLWDSLKLAFEPRVTVDTFVAKFIEENNRPPLVAIDAYVFLFLQRAIEDDIVVTANSFMSKIFYLLSLNVQLIVIFDGRFKPLKLRHEKFPTTVNMNNSYHMNVELFRKADQSGYQENLPIINRIKTLLIRYKIDYLQAPAEAEAQCAWLQKHGLVDYVISNDSDALVFGANQIWRNYNRYEQDTNGSPRKNSSAPKSKYYITPVYLSNITRVYGLDTKRLIFLATLRGGDYSSGVDKIGIVNATKLALCGTDFITRQKQSKATKRELKARKKDSGSIEIRDFASMTIACFIKPTCENLIKTDSHLYEEVEWKNRLKNVNIIMNKTIKAKSRVIFNRLFTGELTINGELMLLYLFPIVSPFVYKFLLCSISSHPEPTDTISIPQEYQDRFSQANSDQLTRINNVIALDDNIIGYLHLEYSKEGGKFKIDRQIFVPKDDQDLTKQYRVSSDYDFYIKYVIIKIIAQREVEGVPIEEIFHIDKFKIEDDLQFVMIKYSTKMLYTLFPKCIESNRDYGDVVSMSKNYVWLPLNVVRQANPKFYSSFENSIKDRSAQTTTLDHFGTFPKSPTKVGLSNMSPNRKPSLSKKIGSPIKMGSFKRSLPKRKPSILPGQSFLDSFMTSENPFLDNTFQKGITTNLGPVSLKRPLENPDTGDVIQSPTKRLVSNKNPAGEQNPVKLAKIPWDISSREIIIISDSSFSDDN
jgi:Holliday junction resolvase YEN1